MPGPKKTGGMDPFRSGSLSVAPGFAQRIHGMAFLWD